MHLQIRVQFVNQGHFKESDRFKAEVRGSTISGSRMMIVVIATLCRLMLNIEIRLKEGY